MQKLTTIERIKGILAQPMIGANVRNLLVDTRILLQAKGKERQYPTLKFYCDWVVHPVLSGRTANQILAEMDGVLERWCNRQIPMPQEFQEKVGYQVGFYGFEEELETFLKTVGINMVGSGLVVNWRRFEALYCQCLVGDCLLMYGGKKPLKVIHTARVELFKIDEWPEHLQGKREESLPYGIKWTFRETEIRTSCSR